MAHLILVSSQFNNFSCSPSEPSYSLCNSRVVLDIFPAAVYEYSITKYILYLSGCSMVSTPVRMFPWLQLLVVLVTVGVITNRERATGNIHSLPGNQAAGRNRWPATRDLQTQPPSLADSCRRQKSVWTRGAHCLSGHGETTVCLDTGRPLSVWTRAAISAVWHGWGRTWHAGKEGVGWGAGGGVQDVTDPVTHWLHRQTGEWRTTSRLEGPTPRAIYNMVSNYLPGASGWNRDLGSTTYGPVSALPLTSSQFSYKLPTHFRYSLITSLLILLYPDNIPLSSAITW